MASKSIVVDAALAAALQRFSAAAGCCWVIMRFSAAESRGDALQLQLAVENGGDFDGFRSAVQALDGGGGAAATAFAVLKVNLSEAKGGLQVDALGRQKTVFFTYVPVSAPAFERACTSEAKGSVRAALGVVVHVEYTVESAGEIEEAAVLTRVKQSTGGARSRALAQSSSAPLLSLPPQRFTIQALPAKTRPQSHSALPLQRSTPSPKSRGEARASCCDPSSCVL